MPVSATIFAKIATADGTHPPALREAIVDVDKDIRLQASDYQICTPQQLEGQTSKHAVKSCGDALVGEGTADIEVAAAEESMTHYADLLPHSPLLIFNGGEKRDKTTLLIHAFITTPSPTAIVTTVTIVKRGTGIHLVAKIPAIAEGRGSLLDFSFTLEKVGVLEAKCPDGTFKVNIPKLLFKNEAQIPNVAATTSLKGSIAVPCTPKG